MFLALHLLVWTALPALLYPNLPLDLIEALTYGREWQLGYDKLPPLPWWLVEVVYRLVGRRRRLLRAGAGRGGRRLRGGVGDRASAGRPASARWSPSSFSTACTTSITPPPSSITTSSSCRSGRSPATPSMPRSRAAACCTGCCSGSRIGLALWAKYFVVVLAAPLALFLLFDRDARKALATPGPWIALAVALVGDGAAPRSGSCSNDFLPFAYASARAAPSRGLLDHVLHPVVFALGQFGFLLPALLIAAALVWPRPKADEHGGRRRRKPMPSTAAS